MVAIMVLWVALAVLRPCEAEGWVHKGRSVLSTVGMGWAMPQAIRGLRPHRGGRPMMAGLLTLLLIPGAMASGGEGEGPDWGDVGHMALGMAVPMVGGIIRDNRPSFAVGDDGEGDEGLGVDSGTRKGDGDGRGWVGSDMSVRHSDAGLRICTFNSQKKLGISVGETPYLEMVVDEFVEYKYDVMVIQEPGQIAAILPTASCLMAQEGGKAYGFESDSREGGCLVLVSRPWATLDPKQVRTDAKGRVCALEFVGAERRGEEPLQRLLVVGVHGVNSPHVTMLPRQQPRQLRAT